MASVVAKMGGNGDTVGTQRIYYVRGTKRVGDAIANNRRDETDLCGVYCYADAETRFARVIDREESREAQLITR